ncbi:MAG: hypothetical protein CFE26_04515 [Verrucomicrobiales bacterium VVV1]|nr:MAG: hypothetical protein CFE26_04515 [Verrucomicrobiales bacterium VVV1]
MKPKSLSSFALLQFSCFALGVMGVKAANFTFDSNTSATGAQDGNGTWNTANVNWWNGTADVAWGAANVAIFGGGTDGTYSVTLGNAITAQALTFNNSGYTLSAASALTLSLTNVGNGVISVASNKSGTIGSNLTVAFNAASNTGTRVDLTTSGTLNIASGGTVSRTGQVTTGFTTTGGTLGFMGSGTINVAGTLSYNVATPVASGGIVLASNAGNNNTLNVNGGTVSSNSTINGISLVASGSSGTLNVNSGTVSTTGTAAVTSGINLANGTGTTGTVNLNGGTISTFQINSNYYNGSNVLTTGGTSNFNFNGGTLRAIANNASFMGGLTAATVKTGGAVVDSNGFNVTIAQALLHDATLGATLDGGLTKNGNGTLTLSGASTFTGNANVNSGTLLVNGSLASAASVASNATLGGTGTIAGAVTSAGILAPGNVGTAGTLTLSNGLTLSGGTLGLDLNGANNATGGGTNDLIAITGNLALSGTVLVSPTFTGGTPAASTSYTFATYSGTLTGGSNFAAGSRSVNIDTATSGLVKLVYTGASSASLNWSSSSSGAWDVVNSLNWFNNGSSTTDRFYQADTVTFGDTAGVQTSISLAASVSPGSIVVNSDTNAYSISGAGSIAGTGSLTKSGTSTLVLGTANTYTGGTTLNGGAISISNPSALGASSGGLAINGGKLITTQSGTFTNGARVITIGASGAEIQVNSTGTAGSGQFFLDTASTLAGSGNLTITGNGTLGTSGAGNFRIGASQSFSGSITVRDGGSVEYSNSAATASGTVINIGNQGALIVPNLTATNIGTVNVTGGTSSVINFSNGTAGVLGAAVNLAADATVTVTDWYNPSTARSGTISGLISGTGGLTVQGSGGSLTLSAANTYTGATTINTGSTLALGGTAGALSSSSSITNNGNFTVNRTNSVVQGTDFSGSAITGTGSLSATGTGLSLTLNTANSYTGNTLIGSGGNNSVLRATASGALGSGNIQMDLTGNATTARLELSGGITLSNSAIQFTGRNNTSVGIQNLSGSNTLSGTVNLQPGGGSYTVQSDSGLLTLSGNIANASGTGTRTLTLTGAGNGVVSGVLGNGTGTTALTKSGSGTWEISSTSSYSGATSVNAGKLVVNGNISTSVSTVSGTGTLGGAGTVGAVTVQTGGTLAPGSSIESLGAGTISLESGSTFAYELDSQSLNGDLLSSSGALAISSGANLTLTELASGTLTSGKLTLISYASWNGGLFTYLGNTLDDDSVITLGGNSWVFNYNDLTGGSNFTADQVGASGFVTMTAVPEPGATLLGLLGSLALLRRRRA